MTYANEPINHITEAEKDRMDSYNDINYAGLTKREYFSAKALQALLASGSSGSLTVAQDAVMYADELIAALNK